MSATSPERADDARGTRGRVVLAASFVALAVAITLSISVGAGRASLLEAIANPASQSADVVFHVRLPRALLAALSGAGLSLVGVALQSLLRNPLAEPFMLGVSGGSALGATIAIIAGFSAETVFGAPMIPLAAMIGGLGATAIVHGFASDLPGSRSIGILLTGIVVNALASSLITFLRTIVTPTKTIEVLGWLVGSIGLPSSLQLGVLAVYLAIGGTVLFVDAGRLNLLSLGDDAAEHLGVRVRTVERRVLVASALVVGAIVSNTGIIAFVGLIVPHGIRRVLGPDARVVMPSSIGFGGALLVLCDLASRMLFHAFGTEPPVGAITALLGGALFLVLLRSFRPA